MSDVKQFLDKDGLNAFWNKTCSTFIPNRPSTKFYPFIGTASRGTRYKVTLPYNGVNVSYKVFMMNTMEIVLGSSYLNGATGKIFLSYYFTRDANGTWLTNDLRAFAIGCNVAPTITYQISNPAIFWVTLNSTAYNVISIKNLTAEDSAPSYDYRNTTIEAVTDLPTTDISLVPITILSNDGNKLKYNGNEIAVVNHTHDYLPLIGGTMTGPIVFNGTDSNRNIIRINNTTGDASKSGDYGFTLKYLGAGTGNNALGLYSDDQSASSQILAAEWKQDGTLFARSINPAISNNYTLGTPDYRWAEIYSKNVTADTFIGNLSGNATSANKASALLSIVNGNTTTAADTGEIIYSRFQQDMLGSLPGDNNANGVITINTHAGDYHHQLGFTGSGMFYRRRHGSALNNSASWSKIAMISDIPTDYTRVGDGTIYIYPHSTNEINFGGTNTADTIYFGYRPKDNNTTAPSKYVFGRDGAASVNANGFIKKDSSDSYVLLGGGGHKPVSDLTSQDHYKNIVSNINGITQTPAHGETFTVPNISVNENGHITNLGTTTIKLPTVESSGGSGSTIIPETIDNDYTVYVAPNTSKVIYGGAFECSIELENPKLGQVNEYMIFIINGELYTDEGEPDVEIYPPLGCNLYWSDNDAPNLIQEYCAIEINIKVIPTHWYWRDDEDDYEIESCVAFGTYTIYPDYNE